MRSGRFSVSIRFYSHKSERRVDTVKQSDFNLHRLIKNVRRWLSYHLLMKSISFLQVHFEAKQRVLRQPPGGGHRLCRYLLHLQNLLSPTASARGVRAPPSVRPSRSAAVRLSTSPRISAGVHG